MATKKIFQIKSFIEDKRSEVIGSISSALELRELSCISFFLHLAENWISLKKETLKILDDLQNEFLRVIFKVPQSTPLSILYFDTKTLSMKNRIWKKKVLFAHHLEQLPPSSLAAEIWAAQKKYKYPGLEEETREILCELGLRDMEESCK